MMAEDVLDAVRAKAISTGQYTRRIEVMHREGRLTESDVEQAYRGAFLNFHSTLENAIEKLFLGLLTRRITHRLSSVRPLAAIPSNRVAIDMVFNGRKYVDWLPYSKYTLERAGIYFSRGEPFTRISAKERLFLDSLTTLRNALAHESSHSLRRFASVFTDGKQLLPAERRPAGYLRGEHVAGRRRFEYLTIRAAAAIAQLS